MTLEELKQLLILLKKVDKFWWGGEDTGRSAQSDVNSTVNMVLYSIENYDEMKEERENG